MFIITVKNNIFCTLYINLIISCASTPIEMCFTYLNLKT